MLDKEYATFLSFVYQDAMLTVIKVSVCVLVDLPCKMTMI